MRKIKPSFIRITEPDEGNIVHIGPSSMADAVTLCGLTDFIGHDQSGAETTKPISCRTCMDIVNFVHAHRRPKISKHKPK